MTPTHDLLRLRASALLCAASALAACRTVPRPSSSIGHVFIIVLENKGYDTTFRAGTDAPYLADTMVKQGALLRQYYGTGHFSLDNYIAMISGVSPTVETQSDCPHFDDFVETGTAADGQPIGKGCVYPAHVRTIANQLAARSEERRVGKEGRSRWSR